MFEEVLEGLVRINQVAVEGKDIELIVVVIRDGVLVEQLVVQSRDVPTLVLLSLDVSFITIGDRREHEDAGGIRAFILGRSRFIRISLGIEPLEITPGPENHGLEVPAHLIERGLGLPGGPYLVPTDPVPVEGHPRHGHQKGKENDGNRHRHHQLGQGESPRGASWKKGNGHGWEREGVWSATHTEIPGEEGLTQ